MSLYEQYYRETLDTPEERKRKRREWAVMRSREQAFETGDPKRAEPLPKEPLPYVLPEGGMPEELAGVLKNLADPVLGGKPPDMKALRRKYSDNPKVWADFMQGFRSLRAARQGYDGNREQEYVRALAGEERYGKPEDTHEGRGWFATQGAALTRGTVSLARQPKAVMNLGVMIGSMIGRTNAWLSHASGGIDDKTYNAWLSEIGDANKMIRWYDERGKSGDLVRAANDWLQKHPGMKRSINPGMIENAAEALPYVAELALLGGPAAPIKFLLSFATAADRLYEDAIARGVSPEKAEQIALAGGLGTSVLEYAEIGKLTKASKRGIMVTALEEMGIEGGQNLGEWLARYEVAGIKPTSEDGKAAWDDMKAAAVLSGVFGGPGKILQHGPDALEAIRNARAEAHRGMPSRRKTEGGFAYIPGKDAESQPPAKQPWEMTAKELDPLIARGDVKAWQITLGQTQEHMQRQDKADIYKIPGGTSKSTIARAHRASVEQALSQAKSVPPEVLADYPDLAEKYGTQSDFPEAEEPAKAEVAPEVTAAQPPVQPPQAPPETPAAPEPEPEGEGIDRGGIQRAVEQAAEAEHRGQYEKPEAVSMTQSAALAQAQERFEAGKAEAARELAEDMDVEPEPGEGDPHFVAAIRKNIKARIRAVTQSGSRELTVRETDLLRNALEHEERGARREWLRGERKAAAAERQGERKGQLELQQVQLDNLELIEAELPPEKRGRLFRAVLRGRTPTQQQATLTRIWQVINQHRDSVATAELKDALANLDKRHLRAEYQDRAEAVLGGFRMKKTSQEVLHQMRNVLEYVEREGEENVAVPLSLLRQAEQIIADHDAGKKALSELSPDEKRTIAYALNAIRHENDVKNEWLAGREKRRVDDDLKAAPQEIKDYGGEKYRTPAGRTFAREPGLAGRLADWFTGLIHRDAQRPKTIINKIVGKTGEVVRRVLWDNMHEGNRQKFALTVEGLKDTQRLLEDSGLTREHFAPGGDFNLTQWVQPKQGTVTDLEGKPLQGVELTLNQQMRLYEMWLDLDNRDVMIKSGFTVGEEQLKGFRFDREALLDIFQDMPEDARNAVERGAMYRTARLGPLVNEAWQRLFGVPLFAKQEGLHANRQRDARYLAQQKEPMALLRGWAEHDLSDQGIFKQRKGGKTPLTLSTGWMENHVEQIVRMSSYIGQYAPSLDAVRLLDNVGFQEAVRSAFGRRRGRQLLHALNRYVRDYAGLDITAPSDNLNRITNTLTRLGTRGIMGLNPPSIAIQIFGTLNLLQESSIGEVANGFSQLAQDDMSFKEFVDQHSPLLWLRYHGSPAGLVTPGTGGLEEAVTAVFGSSGWDKTLAPISWGDRA
ncbi:MAG: hypothetical protein WC683_05730, partial [bacterium]